MSNNNLMEGFIDNQANKSKEPNNDKSLTESKQQTTKNSANTSSANILSNQIAKGPDQIDILSPDSITAQAPIISQDPASVIPESNEDQAGTLFLKYAKSQTFKLVYSKSKEKKPISEQIHNFASVYINLSCVMDFGSNMFQTLKPHRWVARDEQSKFSLKSKIEQEERDKFISCKEEIEFDSRFECGNLFAAYSRIPNQEYDLILQNDTNTKGYAQWFFFKVSNFRFKDIKVIFRIVNLAKGGSLFNQGMKPAVFSLRAWEKQRTGWSRPCRRVQLKKSNISKESDLTQKYDILQFSYQFEDEDDQVYFALNIPYSYSKMISHLDTSIKDANTYRPHIIAMKEILCHSVSNNPIPIVSITNKADDIPSNNDQTKKKVYSDKEQIKNISKSTVWLIARQHPGETVSSFVMEGVINTLLGETPEADYLRQRYVFKIIPMMNPDGVIYGNSRCNLAGVDINRQWLQPSRILHPSVYYAKKALKQTRDDGQKMEYFIDLHGHSKKMNSFIYACRKESDLVSCRVFPVLFSKVSEIFQFKDCTFAMEEYKESAARIAVWNEVNRPREDYYETCNVFTLETSFYGFTALGGSVRRCFKIDDLLGLGVHLVKTIYYDSAPQGDNDQTINKQTLITQITQNIEQFIEKDANTPGSGSDSDPLADELDMSEKLKAIIPPKVAKKIAQDMNIKWVPQPINVPIKHKRKHKRKKKQLAKKQVEQQEQQKQQQTQEVIQSKVVDPDRVKIEPFEDIEEFQKVKVQQASQDKSKPIKSDENLQEYLFSDKTPQITIEKSQQATIDKIKKLQHQEKQKQQEESKQSKQTQLSDQKRQQKITTTTAANEKNNKQTCSEIKTADNITINMQSIKINDRINEKRTISGITASSQQQRYVKGSSTSDTKDVVGSLKRSSSVNQESPRKETATSQIKESEVLLPILPGMYSKSLAKQYNNRLILREQGLFNKQEHFKTHLSDSSRIVKCCSPYSQLKDTTASTPLRGSGFTEQSKEYDIQAYGWSSGEFDRFQQDLEQQEELAKQDNDKKQLEQLDNQQQLQLLCQQKQQLIMLKKQQQQQLADQKLFKNSNDLNSYQQQLYASAALRQQAGNSISRDSPYQQTVQKSIVYQSKYQGDLSILQEGIFDSLSLSTFQQQTVDTPNNNNNNNNNNYEDIQRRNSSRCQKRQEDNSNNMNKYEPEQQSMKYAQEIDQRFQVLNDYSAGKKNIPSRTLLLDTNYYLPKTQPTQNIQNNNKNINHNPSLKPIQNTNNPGMTILKGESKFEQIAIPQHSDSSRYQINMKKRQENQPGLPMAAKIQQFQKLQQQKQSRGKDRSSCRERISSIQSNNIDKHRRIRSSTVAEKQLEPVQQEQQSNIKKSVEVQIYLLNKAKLIEDKYSSLVDTFMPFQNHNREASMPITQQIIATKNKLIKFDKNNNNNFNNNSSLFPGVPADQSKLRSESLAKSEVIQKTINPRNSSITKSSHKTNNGRVSVAMTLQYQQQQQQVYPSPQRQLLLQTGKNELPPLTQGCDSPNRLVDQLVFMNYQQAQKKSRSNQLSPQIQVIEKKYEEPRDYFEQSIQCYETPTKKRDIINFSKVPPS